MKILCISDQIDPLIYSNSAKERYKNIDIILSAGDLPMEYIDFIVSTLNKPTFFVFGNHNLKEFSHYHKVDGSKQQSSIKTDIDDLKHSHGAAYLGFKTAKEENLLLVGLSGSKRYNTGLNQYTEKQMFFKICMLIPHLIVNKIKYGRYLDILLTHAAPQDIHDKKDPCHEGFKCFRWFMTKFQPHYLIHGHIHLYDMSDIRVSQFERTTVINAYSQYILDTEDTL